jgi:hypothetical protein
MMPTKAFFLQQKVRSCHRQLHAFEMTAREQRKLLAVVPVELQSRELF